MVNRPHFNSGCGRRAIRSARDLRNRKKVSPYYNDAKVRSIGHVDDRGYSPKESIFSDPTNP